INIIMEPVLAQLAYELFIWMAEGTQKVSDGIELPLEQNQMRHTHYNNSANNNMLINDDNITVIPSSHHSTLAPNEKTFRIIFQRFEETNQTEYILKLWSHLYQIGYFPLPLIVYKIVLKTLLESGSIDKAMEIWKIFMATKPSHFSRSQLKRVFVQYHVNVY